MASFVRGIDYVIFYNVGNSCWTATDCFSNKSCNLIVGSLLKLFTQMTYIKRRRIIFISSSWSFLPVTRIVIFISSYFRFSTPFWRFVKSTLPQVVISGLLVFSISIELLSTRSLLVEVCAMNLLTGRGPCLSCFGKTLMIDTLCKCKVVKVVLCTILFY